MKVATCNHKYADEQGNDDDSRCSRKNNVTVIKTEVSYYKVTRRFFNKATSPVHYILGKSISLASKAEYCSKSSWYLERQAPLLQVSQFDLLPSVMPPSCCWSFSADIKFIITGPGRWNTLHLNEDCRKSWTTLKQSSCQKCSPAQVIEPQLTLYVRARATPTMKRKNGITKSARVMPFQGEWLIDGQTPPALSTSIITCTKAVLSCRS